MVRIAVVAGALLVLGGASPAQQGGGAAPAQLAPPAQVEADGVPEEVKAKLAEFVLRAEAKLGGEEFGLKPPELRQFRFRLRTPRPTDAIVAGPQIYTGGSAALTMCARSVLEAMNGNATFDPIYTVLDAAAETCWANRIGSFWLMPSAIRNGVDRHFSQRVLEVLSKEAAGDPNAPHWPGAAVPRKGSFESLPAGHPLVEDRDRVVELLDRFVQRPGGQAELLRILTFCSDNQLKGPKTAQVLGDMLKPLFDSEAGAGPKSLLPDATFATREPWPGPDKNPLALRMNGVGGEASQVSVALRLTYGEQRTTPTVFQEWSAGGAPTLLFHAPQQGIWSLKNVEFAGRRTVGEKDDAADRLLWVVVLDERFHELSRWPFAQTSIPVDKAGWVKLPLTASPELPAEFWFIALEAEDPGAGAKLEICVRPDALAEHCFRSVPNRKLSGLAAPVDFAVFADVSGRGLERMITPAFVLEALKKWCKPKDNPK